MRRTALDVYDEIPREMRTYLQYHGWHFGKKACEYAVSMMRKRNSSTDKLEKIEPYCKEDVETLMKKYGVVIENTYDYDFVFVANMGKADYLKSSVPDEQHLALYIKDVMDDADAGDGTVMRRWYATMVANGVGVDWSEML